MFHFHDATGMHTEGSWAPRVFYQSKIAINKINDTNVHLRENKDVCNKCCNEVH